MVLQAPGGLPPREVFLLGTAAQPGALLTPAAAQEELGAFFFLPHRSFWRTQNST